MCMAREPKIQLGKNRIREFREGRGLTQEQLAEMVGVSHATIGRLERSAQDCKLSIITRVSEALGMSVSEILEDPSTPDDPYAGMTNVERLIELIPTLTDAEAKVALEVFRAMFLIRTST